MANPRLRQVNDGDRGGIHDPPPIRVVRPTSPAKPNPPRRPRNLAEIRNLDRKERLAMSYYPTPENGGMPPRPRPADIDEMRAVVARTPDWFDAPPSWWRFIARRRWRDRVPRGFR